MIRNRSVILRILPLLLKPVVRLALKNALGVREVQEALKKSFVDTAAHDIRGSGSKSNVSRISIVTGIHRRDVLRLLEEQETPGVPINLVSKIVAQWENDHRFQTRNGKPRVLSYEGADSDFSELVRSVSSDMHSGTVLFQLERLNMIEKTAHGLKLVTAVYEVREDLDKAYMLLGLDLDDLSRSVQENIEQPERVPQLHARTDYDNVYVDALPEIREWLLKEGALLHQRARAFISQFDQDLNPHIRKEAGARVVLGTFGRVEQIQLPGNTEEGA